MTKETRWVDVQYFVDQDFDSVTMPMPLDPKQEVTGHVAYIFSRGQCHALAWAINELTGWPIEGDYSTGEGDRSTKHVVIRMPDDGKALGYTADITGIHCFDCSYRPIKPETISQNRMRGFLKPNLEYARWYAPAILKAIKAQHAERKRTKKWNELPFKVELPPGYYGEDLEATA
jgi:hypothetical protein